MALKGSNITRPLKESQESAKVFTQLLSKLTSKGPFEKMLLGRCQEFSLENLKELHCITKENRDRLVSLLEQQDEYVRKNNFTIPGYSGFQIWSAPEFDEQKGISIFTREEKEKTAVNFQSQKIPVVEPSEVLEDVSFTSNSKKDVSTTESEEILNSATKSDIQDSDELPAFGTTTEPRTNSASPGPPLLTPYYEALSDISMDSDCDGPPKVLAFSDIRNTPFSEETNSYKRPVALPISGNKKSSTTVLAETVAVLLAVSAKSGMSDKELNPTSTTTTSGNEEATESKNGKAAESKNEEVAESENEETTESKNEEEAESKNEEVAESQNEEVAESKNEETTESKNEEEAESKNEEAAERQNEEVAESKNEETTESKNEEEAEIKNEEVAECKNEEVAESKNEEATASAEPTVEKQLDCVEGSNEAMFTVDRSIEVDTTKEADAASGLEEVTQDISVHNTPDACMSTNEEESPALTAEDECVDETPVDISESCDNALPAISIASPSDKFHANVDEVPKNSVEFNETEVREMSVETTNKDSVGVKIDEEESRVTGSGSSDVEAPPISTVEPLSQLFGDVSESEEMSDVVRSADKLAFDLGWDSNDENNVSSVADDDSSHPTRCSIEHDVLAAFDVAASKESSEADPGKEEEYLHIYSTELDLSSDSDFPSTSQNLVEESPSVSFVEEEAEMPVSNTRIYTRKPAVGSKASVDVNVREEEKVAESAGTSVENSTSNSPTFKKSSPDPDAGDASSPKGRVSENEDSDGDDHAEEDVLQSEPVVMVAAAAAEPREEKTNQGNADEQLCIITSVIGNAPFDWDSMPDDSVQDPFQGWDADAVQVIEETQPGLVPKKTNDITKIKGWWKKQFALDKEIKQEPIDDSDSTSRQDSESSQSCQMVFQSSSTKGFLPTTTIKKEPAEPKKAGGAFVCDSLDDFLDREADLKINYEIPHLSAELGIRLTSEELVSRPKVAEEESKNSVKAISDPADVQKKASEESHKVQPKEADMPRKTIKVTEPEAPKPIEIREPEPARVRCTSRRRQHPLSKALLDSSFIYVYSGGKPIKLGGSYNYRRPMRGEGVSTDGTKAANDEVCADFLSDGKANKGEVVLLKKSNFGKSRPESENEEATTVEHQDEGEASEYKVGSRLLGLPLYPGPFAAIHPVAQFHLRKLRNYRTKIDRHWANFASSALCTKNENQRRKRMILPVMCPVKTLRAIDEESKDTTDWKEKSKQLKSRYGIKDCKVVMRRANGLLRVAAWCIEHHCYNCEPCCLKNPYRSQYFRTAYTKRLSPKSTMMMMSMMMKQSPRNVALKKTKPSQSTHSVEVFCARTRGIDHYLIQRNASHLYRKTLTLKIEEFEKRQFESLDNLPATDELAADVPERPPPADPKPVTRVRLPPVTAPPPSDSKPVRKSSIKQIAFSEDITKLLAKKLRDIKSSRHIAASIDNLKILQIDVVELIKLNFVKENFLSQYIRIWYLKPGENSKSRAFLTFTKNPPVKDAINLKSVSGIPPKDLPKVISELISQNNEFDENDYAILHCNGHVWEIHGSVNFTLEKNDDAESNSEKAEIVFARDVEMTELRDVGCLIPEKMQKQAIKWWVMDLAQGYSELKLKIINENGCVVRSSIQQYMRSGIGGFLNFMETGDRIFGVFVIPAMLPYGLVGPFLADEKPELELKLYSKFVPFTYSDGTKKCYPEGTGALKNFIVSVITGAGEDGRTVTGLFLYDRTSSKQSSFFEVTSKNLQPTPKKKITHYNVELEHGYSSKADAIEVDVCEDANTPAILSNLHESCKMPNYSAVVKRLTETKSTKVAAKKTPAGDVPVYLISRIPNLGYVKGKLHHDRSVTIQHPLIDGKTITSSKIGHWLNKLLRRKVKFIPHDLEFDWRVVKNLDDMMNEKPLNKFYLGGTHILCRSGLFYMLSMNKEKIEQLGIDKDAVLKAISDSVIIKEVMEVKELGKLVTMTSECNLSIPDILQLAIKEIAYLEAQSQDLCNLKTAAEMKKWALCRRYMEVLKTFNVSAELKKKLFSKVKKKLLAVQQNRKEAQPEPKKTVRPDLRKSTSGTESEESTRLLVTEEKNRTVTEKSSSTLRVLQPITPEVRSEVANEQSAPDSEGDEQTSDHTYVYKSPPDTRQATAVKPTDDKSEASNADNKDVNVVALESKLTRMYELLEKNSSADDPDEHKRLVNRLNAISEQLSKLKKVFKKTKDEPDLLLSDLNESADEGQATTSSSTAAKSLSANKSIKIISTREGKAKPHAILQAFSHAGDNSSPTIGTPAPNSSTKNRNVHVMLTRKSLNERSETESDLSRLGRKRTFNYVVAGSFGNARASSVSSPKEQSNMLRNVLTNPISQSPSKSARLQQRYETSKSQGFVQLVPSSSKTVFSVKRPVTKESDKDSVHDPKTIKTFKLKTSTIVRVDNLARRISENSDKSLLRNITVTPDKVNTVQTGLSVDTSTQTNDYNSSLQMVLRRCAESERVVKTLQGAITVSKITAKGSSSKVPALKKILPKGGGDMSATKRKAWLANYSFKRKKVKITDSEVLSKGSSILRQPFNTGVGSVVSGQEKSQSIVQPILVDGTKLIGFGAEIEDPVQFTETEITSEDLTMVTHENLPETAAVSEIETLIDDQSVAEEALDVDAGNEDEPSWLTMNAEDIEKKFTKLISPITSYLNEDKK